MSVSIERVATTTASEPLLTAPLPSRYTSQLVKILVILLGLLLVVLVGIIDHGTGHEIYVAIFYLVPIVYVVWFAGRWPGFLIAVGGCVACFVSDVSVQETHSHFAVPYWNAATRLAFFAVTVYLLSALRIAHHHLEDKVKKGTEALTVQIDERKQLEERMQQSERLAVIGEVVAALAHEGRNALQGTQACLERLTWRLQGQAEALDLVGRIQQEQDRLHRHYEDIRRYAAPLKLNREYCDVAEVWRCAWLQLTSIQHARDVSLREITGKLDLVCHVDPHRLEQVFSNIFDNALAACRDPVHIGIRCHSTELEGHPAIAVAVGDNGPGLSAEQRQRIFEPFYTTKTTGTGLGMAIAKRIIDAHAGLIALGDGAPGTEIILILPRRGK